MSRALFVAALLAAAPAFAEGRVYLDTLPALGWSFRPGAGAEGELALLRGRERLALSIAAHDGGSELQTRLFIRPTPAHGD